MSVLLLIAILSGLGWVAFSTIRAFVLRKVCFMWWGALVLSVLAGVPAGVWCGFRMEWQINANTRLFGFPFALAVFRLEDGNWIDYVGSNWAMMAVGTLDAVIVALLFIAPVSVAFRLCQWIAGRKLGSTCA
jgi:hypothetical protein